MLTPVIADSISKSVSTTRHFISSKVQQLSQNGLGTRVLEAAQSLQRQARGTPLFDGTYGIQLTKDWNLNVNKTKFNKQVQVLRSQAENVGKEALETAVDAREQFMELGWDQVQEARKQAKSWARVLRSELKGLSHLLQGKIEGIFGTAPKSGRTTAKGRKKAARASAPARSAASRSKTNRKKTGKGVQVH